MDTKLADFKISLNQMNVIPGRPDLNAQYIIAEMEAARQRGVNLIIFPELAVPGYFIGDKLENKSFANDISHWNEQIWLSSQGLTVVFGTVVTNPNPDVRGEDGQHRMYNAGIVAINGRKLGYTVKTLQPNYRYFNDDKHLFSGRKIAAEANTTVDQLIRNFPVPKDPTQPVSEWEYINLGVILCEDMWHADYPINPTKMLVDAGADMVVNLSASPWGWQKNRKRHQVVNDLLAESPVPFVYVNITGAQNTGKNVLVFDGSSTVYAPNGKIAHEVEPYFSGGQDFVFPEVWTSVEPRQGDDTAELYQAIKHGTQAQLELLPPAMRKVLVGLSGGIDSAVATALYVDILGPENVFTVNMPSKYNTERTKTLAETIAANLGVRYEVVSIDKLVEALMVTLPNVQEGSVAYENVQARMRMEILAAKAQAQIGGVFSCNSNKAEFAFGYGTMYADIAGFLAPLGDLVKREVRQIADYQNRVVFGREVIPAECISQKPSAELGKDQFDPFDYGDTSRRGYHDELIRAFTEFARDPEWVLNEYLNNHLEESFQLPAGTLNRLFPTAEAFVMDLEKHWGLFARSYVKRVQSPPIIVTSKRAFGRDLEEAIMLTHYTARYGKLRSLAMLKGRKERVAIFGGSFNPPGLHHAKIIAALSKQFDRIIVVPCGGRPDKPSSGLVGPEDREQMVQLAFAGLDKVEIDCFDLGNDKFTPTYILDERYKGQIPHAEIYHVVGGDLLTGGANGESQIQRGWQAGDYVWDNLKFAVLSHDALPVAPADFPARYQLVQCEPFDGRSTFIRELIAAGQDPHGLIENRVGEYIKQHGLYLNRSAA